MSSQPRVAVPRLRRMLPTDVTEVAVVERACYAFPWPGSVFRDCLDAGYVCCVYAEESVFGHGIMSVAAGECHILNLCIHPEYQRRGYGAAMLLHLLDQARDRSATVAFLEVRESNVDAYRLYTRLGFNEVGMRQDYYPARFGREHAMVMARNL